MATEAHGPGQAYEPFQYREDDAAVHGARMVRAVVLGIAWGVPAAIAGLTVALRLAVTPDWLEAFSTAVWPGVLVGVFGGGFVGMVAADR